MRFLITLDYELYFGREVGSAKHCMLRPVEALLKVVDRHGAKLTLFVDAGYLCRLQEQADGAPELLQDYDQISSQLKDLVEQGHDVQLHIHPHWEDSSYRNGAWQIDTGRYRLHDFDNREAARIVADYKRALTDIVGDRVFAYRAGGWCLQPFEPIGEALAAHGVWLDSTVYRNGYSPDDIRGFDFRDSPNSTSWRFNDNPLVPKEGGRFLEVPISACRVSPLFYWKLALLKKFARGAYKSFGDGQAMVANAAYYRALLTKPSHSVASIDGAKAGLLETAYRQLGQMDGPRIFNVMGHPKALTPDSLVKLDRFLGRHPELEPVTLQDFR
jgi:peptidoglycan/xylan/chitin deacetylase (PgdA/CDA1 family)